MKATQHAGTPVPVPHLAESLVDATVGKWLKKPGDKVGPYEVICELITEKVSVEMPSPVEGTLTEIVVPEGAKAAVGETLCYIVEPGGEAPASPAAAEDSRAVETAVQPGAEPEDGGMRSRFSPAVLKLAAEHRINVNEVPGTGLGGRITRKDVLAYIESGGPQRSAQAAASRPAAAPPSPSVQASASSAAGVVPPREAAPAAQTAGDGVQTPMPPVRTTGIHLSQQPPTPLIEVEGQSAGGRGETFIDVTPIRNTIASRMRQSVSEIPHAWTMIEVDVTNLVVLRNKLKDEFMRQEGINLTYLAFLLKAVVNAIKDYPIMNSVWAVDKIIVKKDINLSLAVGTEDLVITPVIKNADQKNIAGLAREIHDLTKKARSGRLSLNDLAGGTFTVNNTGSFGSIASYPIINYPQAAILTFESIVKKPVVINDMIAVRSMVNLCLSLDHRILDGVICGRFLQRVKENMEGYSLDTKLY